MCFFAKKKKYAVVAHCSDGDVLINNNGKKYFETLRDAKKAKKDHVGFGCEVEIIECNDVEISADGTQSTIQL